MILRSDSTDPILLPFSDPKWDLDPNNHGSLRPRLILGPILVAVVGDAAVVGVVAPLLGHST